MLRKGQRARTPGALRALAPGVTLSTLAKRTGIAMPHLSRVINRKRGLTIRVARLIAEHTGTTVDRVADVLAV